jgi:hypothetical protein
MNAAPLFFSGQLSADGCKLTEIGNLKIENWCFFLATCHWSLVTASAMSTRRHATAAIRKPASKAPAA